MNNKIAESVANEELTKLGKLPYSEHLKQIDKLMTHEQIGPDGNVYQIEVQAFWDNKKHGPIRVMVSVDDGRLRAFLPLTRSLIISPDGSLP